MNIVYALTRNIYEQLLPSISSLAAMHPDARVFILAEDDELPFELPIEAEIINVSNQEVFTKKSVNYNNHFKYINLLKVCYPSILGVNKVIHLDVDTIVCDSLESLWTIDVKDRWFAACPEYEGKYKPFGDLYFNMGVALINLQQMRRDGAEQAMVWYLNTIKQPWADQDAWNLFGIAFNKWVAFPTRFNESPMTGKTDEPAIVHFCSVLDWWDNESMDRAEMLNEWKQATKVEL